MNTKLLNLIQTLDADPEYQQLSFGEQLHVRSSLIPPMLRDDPEFMSEDFTDEDRRGVLEGLIFDAAPSVRDKAFQQQGEALAKQAKYGGNPAAGKIVANYVGASQLIATSLLVNVLGSKMMAPMIADTRQVKVTPELEASQLWAADPRDRARMSEYFEAMLSTDERNYRRARVLKTMASIGGPMIDMIPLMATMGPSSAPIGLGRIFTMPATKAAARATSQLSKFLWGAAQGAAHATLTAAIGVARENALEALNKADADPDFSHTLKKNLKWFGAYYAGDVLFNVLFDTAIPMIRGAELTFLRPKGKPLVDMPEEQFRRIVNDAKAGREIDPYWYSQLPDNYKMSIRALQVRSAMATNFPNASAEEAMTVLAASEGYMVAQTLKTRKLTLRYRPDFKADNPLFQGGGRSFMHFDDYKSLGAWLVNSYGTGGGGVRQLNKLKKAEIAELGLTPATMTRDKWLTLAKSSPEAHDQAMREASQAIVREYGTDNLQELAAKRLDELRELGMSAKVDFDWTGYEQIKDTQIVAAAGLVGGRPGFDDAHFNLVMGKLADPAYKKYSDIGPIVLFHELEHVYDFHMGWMPLLDPVDSWHHAFYMGGKDFDIAGAHRYAVKRSIERGYQVPVNVMKDYPDLMPYAYRPAHYDAAMAQQFAGAGKRIEIRDVLRSRLPEQAAGSSSILTKLFATSIDESGELSARKLNQFTQAYLKGSNMPEQLGRRYLVNETTLSPTDAAKYPGTKAGDRIIRLSRIYQDQPETELWWTPKTVGFRKDKDILQEFISKIDEDNPNLKAAGGKLTSPQGWEYNLSAVNQRLIKEYEPQLKKQQLFTRSFSDYIAAKVWGGDLVMGQQGKVTLVQYNIPNKPTSGVKSSRAFDSYDEATRHMVASGIDTSVARQYLAEQGLQLNHAKARNVWQVVRGKDFENPLYEEASIFDLFVKHDDLMPKIPSSYGPMITMTDAGKLEAQYSKGGALIGNTQNVLAELDRFKNPPTPMRVSLARGKRGEIIADRTTHELEVYIPEIGYRRRFAGPKALEEAKAYLQGGYDQYEEIVDVALAKGYRLEPVNGKWILYSEGDTAVVVDSLEGVKAALAKAPIPEWAPELIWDMSMLEPYAKPMKDGFKPLDYEGVKTTRPWQGLAKFVRTPDQWFSDWVQQGGDKEVLRLYRLMEGMRQGMRAEENRMGDIIDAVFRRPTGKMPKHERRVFIGEYLKASEDQKPIVARMRQLTNEEIQVADEVRNLWNGLYTKFGVTEKFITDYLPRVNKFYLLNRKRMYPDGEAMKFLKDVFGTNPPKELDAWFKHRRTSELIGLALEDDPLILLQRYSLVGHRQLYLGDAFREAHEYLKTTSDGMGAERLYSYMNDVMGLPQTSLEAHMANASLEVLAKWGLKGQVARDYLSSMMSISYMAALAGNPGIAIRNAMQPWVTLAPRLGLNGNKLISGAVRKLSHDKAGMIYESLSAKGIFLSNLPLYGGHLFSQETILGKMASTGMKWYRNADDFSRAVAFVAYSDMFDDALGRFQKGIINDVQFQEMSGISSMMPDVRERMKALCLDGKWVTAREMGAAQIVDETMFPYRSGMSPYAFRGVMGKVFGMFGHWPLNYVENLRRGFKYGTTAQKVAFGTVWLANSAALYAGFNTLGINANSFLPWVPLQFSGGPYWQFMNMFLLAIGRGYKGRQARAELFGLSEKEGQLVWKPGKGELFQWFVPGGFMMKKIKSAVDLANSGDTWNAFLSATGFTPTPSWLENGF